MRFLIMERYKKIFKETAEHTAKEVAHDLGKQIAKTELIKGRGESFTAYTDVKNKLKKKYTIGSMEGRYPIGFADKKYKYVSKWSNINIEDKKLLNGIIVSDDFRNGDALIVYFK